MKTRTVIQTVSSLTDVIRNHPNLYNQLLINLATARTNEEYRIPGDALYVIDMSSAAVAQIRFNNSGDDAIELKRGRRFQVPFSRFLVTNTAQAGLTVTLLVGKDMAFDFAELGVVDVSQIISPVLRRASNNLYQDVITVGAAATLILPTRTGKRLCATVFNEGTNPCRLGQGGVTYGGSGSTGGLLLPPSASYTHESCLNLYAICNAGLSTVVSYLDNYES